ncbi:FtsX-like permease family protein [Nocardioides currus]|uniref:ABC3 transporter permease C-terminal domain-containing protein n=1 Tax=Nocardioides currus TaxID=2133958 RepID=A0A2R7YYE8_9ACTN|nr:ABC transporter permease [Nocardioides currus]PUA81334.1 hypothetical protein C7S10_09965 [Nocardioides currus]
MTGWRPALRLAWRDALRSRGRTALVVLMITLPVLAVTAAAVIYATAQVTGGERADRALGAADARVEAVGNTVIQLPDPRDGWGTTGSLDRVVTEADLTGVLGADSRVLTIRDDVYLQVPMGDRRISVAATEVDLGDPMTEGLFDVEQGRLPTAAGEAVVNTGYAERGVAIGEVLDLQGSDVEVVGIGRDATYRDQPTVMGLPGGLGSSFDATAGDPEWLVESGPVSWSQVRELNDLGAVVTSREVLADPPAVREQAEQMGYDTGLGDYIAVVALVVTMALLEVILLAGPAFAVGARRQSRALALMAASGGTPRQARRVVLASGVVLGALAAAIGAVLGVVVGLALLPVVQRFSGEWFGPVDITWWAVAVVAACGLLSAVLAAVVPAWIASRQDVVAVLAGRRGDRKPSARTPLLGLVVLGCGVLLSVYGVVGSAGNGEYAIAVSAIVSVLGMIMVVPVVVALIARLSRRFPLTLRYAARDAARHRTRTVPAVAAVAATVAGVVALGIANTSDEAERRSTYRPQLEMGAATVTVSGTSDMVGGTYREYPPDQAVWERVDRAIEQAVPGVERETVDGIVYQTGDGGSRFFDVRGATREDWVALETTGGFAGAAMVSDGDLPGQLALTDEQARQASAALAAGSAVVLAQEGTADRIVLQTYSPDDDAAEPTRLDWPVETVQVDGPVAVSLVVPTTLAEEAGLDVQTVGVYLPPNDLTAAQAKDLEERVAGVSESAYAYVERGYQTDNAIIILLAILFGLGGVLMLGGTLTATFLALSDARPDLATLAAVGASPRSRRGVAASYALVVGFVGAVLGTVVGFIPGVAITWPLTSGVTYGSGSSEGPAGPFLDIPWLLILGLVVVLPLLTALVVGLFARARLPLATRLT